MIEYLTTNECQLLIELLYEDSPLFSRHAANTLRDKLERLAQWAEREDAARERIRQS